MYKTIFIVIIVRFSISPVKPRHRLVLVRPPPLSLVVVRVVASSSGCSKPESSVLSYLCSVQQYRLQPVFDTRVIQLSHPSLVESTENVGIILGYCLPRTHQETPAATPVFLQEPAIRAFVGILG